MDAGNGCYMQVDVKNRISRNIIDSRKRYLLLLRVADSCCRLLRDCTRVEFMDSK